MAFNLAEIFYQRADSQPNQLVILGPHEDTRITYGAFQRDIQRLAEQLHTAGIQAGMNIGLHYPSSQTYIAFTYALWTCGASVTPIPVELAHEEQQQILHHIAIDAMISTQRLKDVWTPFILGKAVELTEPAELLTLKKCRESPSQLAQLNPAFIRFTSGTTGDAKGVVLSHETIYQRIQAANQGLHLCSTDRIVWLLSMAYHFAVSIVAYLTFGATIILCKNSFGSTILQSANRHHATIIYGAPTHYELMTHDRSSQVLPPLRLAIVTTARLPAAVAEAFYQRFGLPLNETYGIIEVGLPAVNLEQPRTKQGSVGKLLPAYALQLQHHGDETVGEILLRGPGLLDAYYDPWQLRAAILQPHHGWLATGDLGMIDDAGFLTIVGRSKEMISVAGMKFFPQEVETVLERHPAIQAACVFGVKAPRWGEIPLAHLVLTEGTAPPSETALKNYCTQHLASYKIPSQFQWVNHLTRTASGKLIRNADKLLHSLTTTDKVSQP
jgi:long-chain acyl-CoA synthetase